MALNKNTWKESDGTWVTKIYHRTTTIFGYGSTEQESIDDAVTTFEALKLSRKW